MDESELLAATKKTLIYSDIFDFPLTKEELWQRLIFPPSVERSIWEEKLKQWVREGKIEKKGQFFFLPGRERVVEKRKREEKIWRKKFSLARKAALFLIKIPGVWWVGLSGRLAAGVARPEDDVDLFIITAPGRVWLTRFWIYLNLFLWGRRKGLVPRSPGEKEGRDKLCLNLFLAADSLALPEKERDLFTAFEMALLRPLAGREKIYRRFLQENSWACRFLPHAFPLGEFGERKKGKKNGVGLFFRLLNRLFFNLQRFYMRGKPPAKIITLNQVFFHPQDKKKKILAFFRQRGGETSS